MAASGDDEVVAQGSGQTASERAIRIFGLQIVGIDGIMGLLAVAIALWMTHAVGVTFEPLIEITTIIFGEMLLKICAPIMVIAAVANGVRLYRSGSREPYWRVLQRSFLAPVNIAHFLRILGLLYLSTMAISNIKPLITLYTTRTYDAFFRKLDTWIFFGNDPFVWLAQFRQPWLQHLMSFSYMSLFYMFLATLSILFVQRRYQALRVFVLGALLAKLVGNGIHFLLPAAGDCYTAEHFRLYNTLIRNLLTREIQVSMYQQLEEMRKAPDLFMTTPFLGIAAFPSLHAAQLYMFWRLARRYHWWVLPVYVPIGALLLVSTMYFGWHYLTDLVAGWILGWIAFRVAKALIVGNLKLVRSQIAKPLPEK